MTGLRTAALAAVLAAVLAGTACNPFRKRKPVTVPPPPKIFPLPTRPKEKAPAPEIPAPPQPETSPAPDIRTAEPPPGPPRPTPEPPAPPRRRRPAAKQSPAPPPPEPAGSTVPSVPSPQAPQLRPVLTAEQQQQLSQSITQRLERARQALAAVSGRRLNRSQQETVRQIRTFVQQAAEAAKNDLIRANNLAERADVLSQSLLRDLQ